MFHSTSSQMPLQARRQANNTNNTIKDRKNFIRCDPPPMRIELSVHDILLTDDEDDFPTPRAFPSQAKSPRSAALASSCYSPRRTSNISVVTSFEEDQASLSDVSSSDAESIEVPFKVSNSVKKAIKRARAKQERPSSIAIPSPSAWPRAQNSFYGREQIIIAPPTSHSRTALSPDALARLSQSHSRPVDPQFTPSLAGSLSTDDHASFSCPSTPDLRSQADEEEENQWDVPLQLHPEALDTLLHLSAELPQKEFAKREEVSIIMHEPEEMQDRGLSICLPLVQADVSPMEDLVSPISVPSPGGFFASLSGNSSAVWGLGHRVEEPDTSEAESFYGVPFRDSQQTFAQTVLTSQCDSDGPPTARRLVRDSEFESDYPESFALDENDIDETYSLKLSQAAESSRCRTDMWIDAQERYMDFLKADAVPEPRPEEKTSVTARSSTQPEVAISEPKKTVRFAEVVEAAIKQNPKPSEERPRDSVLYHAFQHLSSQAKPRDAYIHRDSRAEALRLQRSYMKDSHKARLRGSHCLKTTSQVENIQSCITSKPDSEEMQAKRDAIANASKEQRALQQLSTACWQMQAMKFLDGGHLLPTAALDALKQESANGHQARVLDFGGLPTASWGWQVAIENRDAKVYTVIPTDKGMQADWLEHRGPSNHRIVTCPNAWTLPFPSGMFTVVSARSLHSMLRTRKVIGHDARDQFGACLAELHRVLAPGGVIHFSTLDAEMTAPANSPLATKSIEFAVSLRTHGYDPCAGRHMTDRLQEAGFVDVGRSWMSLPWVSIGGQNNDAITGLVGSLQWESWLLKHQSELGRSEDSLLEGIPEALNDARRLGDEGKASSWRMLIGCAKKPN